MSRKKRIFDVEMPEGPGAEAEPTQGPAQRAKADRAPRRGPMASAIAENAGALTARAEAEAMIRAENDRLAHEYVASKRAGLVMRMIPLDDVMTHTLVRDRKPGPDMELKELVDSIRDVGLSNPIRVEERDDGKVELIQGWRRLSAYRQLREEEGEAWAEIPAGILPHGEGLPSLYRRMVDENMVRKDLSFAEMAAIAQVYAADPATGPTDVDSAVKELFKSASYSKRSYIRAFARLLDQIGPILLYPQEVPRALGLNVLRRLEDDETVKADIAEALKGWDQRSVTDELDVLRQFAADEERTLQSPSGSKVGKAAAGGRTVGRARTMFEMTHGGQRVKCIAGVGELTLKVSRDLTTIERRKLEQGIGRLLDALR